MTSRAGSIRLGTTHQAPEPERSCRCEVDSDASQEQGWPGKFVPGDPHDPEASVSQPLLAALLLRQGTFAVEALILHGAVELDHDTFADEEVDAPDESRAVAKRNLGPDAEPARPQDEPRSSFPG